MNTPNTNDFSKCKVGDKLWCFSLQNCTVIAIDNSSSFPITVRNERFGDCSFLFNGIWNGYQQLFFSEPPITAPPEPPRLPDYKLGQWIAVWDNDSKVAHLRKFKEFQDEKIRVCTGCDSDNTEFGWQNHCTIEELPAVLEKMGEQK